MAQQPQYDNTNKIVAAQIAGGAMNQPSPQTDPQLELIYQSLLCDDPEVKRLIKGEVQEPLNRWRQLTQLLNDCVNARDDSSILTESQAAQIIGLLKEANLLMSKLETQMKKYRYYLPHLLMLSPLMRLSIITQKQANQIKLQQRLMVNRDRLRANATGESDLLDENWCDAVLIAENMAVQESVDGRKLEAITKEAKQVTTVINDQTYKKANRSILRPFG
jgi:hypothetical protein